MKRAVTARGRMTRLARTQKRRAKFSKRYATNCRSALRTCAMMRQGGSTKSKMDQVSFLRDPDNGGGPQQKETRKGNGGMAAALRSRTPSPTASCSQRSMALQCRPWAALSCPRPSFRPLPPTSGRWVIAAEVERWSLRGRVARVGHHIGPQDRTDRGNTAQAAFRRIDRFERGKEKRQCCAKTSSMQS